MVWMEEWPGHKGAGKGVGDEYSERSFLHCITLLWCGAGGGGSSGRNSIPIPPAKCDGNQKDRFGLQKEKINQENCRVGKRYMAK